MINEIEITNFHGISQGKIQNFSPQLNIFIGKNNSGKSTVLDALTLFLSQEKFQNILLRRGWHGLDSVYSLFRYRNLRNNIVLTSGTKTVTIKNIVPNSNNIEMLIKSRSFVTDTIAFKITSLNKRVLESDRDAYIDSNGSFQLYLNSDTTVNPPVVLTDMTAIHGLGITSAYSYIFERGYQAHEELIGIIQKIYPDIKDIRLFSEKIGPEVIYNAGKVPVYAMGDGFKSAYLNLAILLGFENSYLLFEEPENYHHPTSRLIIVQGILHAAKKNQIFISTHSLELIDDIVQNARDIDVRFFDLDLDHETGELKNYSFDLESAKFRRSELESDLRG
jgi:energy-coupling factor transporter ATP-binding protein EcfA2